MRKLFFVVTVISITGCNFHDQRKDEAIEALKKADQSQSPNQRDTSAVKKARMAVQSFVNRFPEDSLSPSFLFELARIYQSQRQYDSSLKFLDRIYSQYPRSKVASKAVFDEGFIYSQDLKLYDRAREKYQLYLDKYSSIDAKMTNDAKDEIEYMGMSPEERLQKIQEKNAKDTTRAPS